ncbi:MAG: hypothetical protein ABIQ16_22755 [Polyangiaceae bacterium]
MTDQRERVSTDPGIGPIDESTATLRSIREDVEVEPDGASLYYEPKPLVAISDHRTLEMETVKLSQDIDPRKLATELSLPRSPPPPRYDSGWPQAEVVLTSSQRPAPPVRRWRVPALLFGVLVALLLLVLARSSAQRSAEQSAGSAPHAEAVAVPGAVAVVVRPTASAVSSSALTAASADLPADSAAPSAPSPSAAPPSSASTVSHSSAPEAVLAVAHRAALKASPQPSATSSALSEPAAKPKRAIY